MRIVFRWSDSIFFLKNRIRNMFFIEGRIRTQVKPTWLRTPAHRVQIYFPALGHLLQTMIQQSILDKQQKRRTKITEFQSKYRNCKVLNSAVISINHYIRPSVRKFVRPHALFRFIFTVSLHLPLSLFFFLSLVLFMDSLPFL